MVWLRPPAIPVVVCALLGGVLQGCTSSNDISPAAQRIAAARSFGDDNRMTVSVEPGRVRETYEAEALAWVAAVHLSAPFGAVRVDNGNFAEQRVLVEVGNVDTGASARPRLTALAAGARRDSRCEDPAFEEQPDLLLAPIPNEVVFTEDGGPALLLDLRVPACAALAIDLQLPPDRDRWTSAVIAVDSDDPAALYEALAAAELGGADHVQVVGRTRRRGDADPYEVFRLALAESGLPFSVTFVASDLGASDEFHAAFGVSDWDVTVGRQRLLSLNTATRYVGPERFSWLQQRDTAPWGGVAVMQIPPYDPNPPGADAISTATDAARLLGVLGALGFRTIIAAAGDGPAERSFAGVVIHDVGRAQRLRGGARITWVTIEAPWRAPVVCNDAGACHAGEVCDRDGFCALPCGTDADCAGADCGPDGTCGVSASVRVNALPP